MQPHHQERYLCKNYQALAERVAKALGQNPTEFELCQQIIATKTFIPAGNTLLAGIADITPNCCVLGRVDDSNFEDIIQLSKKLWQQRTGIGFDLSGLKDPVAGLKLLSKANAEIDLKHRPSRGNMATLEITHPCIKDFISCKDDGVSISNFNISVAVYDTVSDDILYTIAEHAWRTGDPGLVFLKPAQDYGPVKATGLQPIVTCVPCGEQFMHQYETCNLGSVNLNSAELCCDGVINEDRLRATVHTAIQLLDCVVDKLVYPDERIRQVSTAARRVGLGVMGWADYLKRIRVPYDSPEALDLARSFAKLITGFAEEKSRELAKHLGPCYYSTEYRNLSMTCIAPTGGITGLTENRGFAIEPFFSEASQLSAKAHVDMQAAWQSGFHNAVSKTVNLPNTATVQDIVNIYKYAQSRHLKGITIYRDGSKEYQPIALCPQCIN